MTDGTASSAPSAISPTLDPLGAGRIAAHGEDELGKIETRGTDYIPLDERHGKASELFWVWMAGQFCLGVIVIGSLPVVFGLTFWGSLSSLTVGIAVGSILYMPLALFGPRTGTNDPVASGAHFGLNGRVLGALISIFVALGFYALAIWTGGQAVMVAGNHLFSTSTGNGALAVSMAIVAVVTIVVAVYGHATLITTYRVFAVVVGLFLLALVIVQANKFHPSHHAVSGYLLGSYWSTWILAASVGASLPISYATFGGDYSRYFPRKGVSDRSIVFWNGFGMFLSSWLAFCLGAYLQTMFANQNDLFVVGISKSIPHWFLTPFLILAILGTWPQGGLCLYGCGLSTSTISWRVAGRALTTIVLSAIGVGVVYLATIAYNGINSISAFVLIMNVSISPWMAVMLVGFWARRGRYAPLDLQPYTTLGRRGIYWFTGGFNLRAAAAWIPGAVIGLMFSNTSLYVGPFSNSVKGIDLSYSTAFAIAAVIYYLTLRLFPEQGVIPDEDLVEREDELLATATAGLPA
jgi:purine-cytosine permease-like protein